MKHIDYFLLNKDKPAVLSGTATVTFDHDNCQTASANFTPLHSVNFERIK
jgi:hypothetical protein